MPDIVDTKQDKGSIDYDKLDPGPRLPKVDKRKELEDIIRGLDVGPVKAVQVDYSVPRDNEFYKLMEKAKALGYTVTNTNIYVLGANNYEVKDKNGKVVGSFSTICTGDPNPRPEESFEGQLAAVFRKEGLDTTISFGPGLSKEILERQYGIRLLQNGKMLCAGEEYKFENAETAKFEKNPDGSLKISTTDFVGRDGVVGSTEYKVSAFGAPERTYGRFTVPYANASGESDYIDTINNPATYELFKQLKLQDKQIIMKKTERQRIGSIDIENADGSVVFQREFDTLRPRIGIHWAVREATPFEFKDTNNGMLGPRSSLKVDPKNDYDLQMLLSDAWTKGIVCEYSDAGRGGRVVTIKDAEGNELGEVRGLSEKDLKGALALKMKEILEKSPGSNWVNI